MHVRLTIDGQDLSVPTGTTIWDAARMAEIAIPTPVPRSRAPTGGGLPALLGRGRGLRPSRGLPAFERPRMEWWCTLTAGGVTRSRRMLTELLVSEQPDTRVTDTGGDDLAALAEEFDLSARFDAGAGPRPSTSLPRSSAWTIRRAVLCDRCIRACADVQGNDIIGRTGKGYRTRIGFDLDARMGDSKCVSCGECVAACPTTALTNHSESEAQPSGDGLEAVDSVCPYCGVGCALTYHVDRERNEIAYAEGRPSPGNEARLCVKGRYGYDYATHSHRLTRPLIRTRYPKGPLSSEVRSSERNRRKAGGVVDYDEVMPAFREASWDEALDLVARRLTEVRDTEGANAPGGLRLGKVQQRGSLPVPASRARHVRHQ